MGRRMLSLPSFFLCLSLAHAQLDPVEVFLLEEPGQQTAVQGRPAPGGTLTQASIEDQLEAEIIKLERETKLAKRYSNFLRYESIFLRIGQTGLLAVARNMQYAASNTIFQADDDEDDNEDDGEDEGDDDDDDDDDDNKRRLIGDILLEYLFDEEHLDESPGIERSLTDVWEGWKASGVASEGRSIVPQFPGEPLFYTPPTYWLQVLGRALTAGGFMGPTILGLQRLDLTCGLPTWRSLRNQYQQLFAPAGLPKIELDFRINQFARTMRRELSCLDGSDEYGAGTLNFLQDQLKSILAERISKEAADTGSSSVLSEENLNSAIQRVYAAIAETRQLMEEDWLLSSSLTLFLLITKLLGWGLLTWGRNLGTWSTEIPFSNVTTAQRLGILGRTLGYVRFSTDDFRTLASYSPPDCDSNSLHTVLNDYTDLLYPDKPLDGLEGRLQFARFKFEATNAISCLTSSPSEFVNLETLRSQARGRQLEDELDDVIDLVDLRLKNLPP